MSETWLQEYIFLAFRLHRVVETTYGSPFVEDYWGPPAWQKLVEAEPETATHDLVRRWLQGPDRLAIFHRLLTEQWTPSQLAGNILPAIE